LSLIENAVYAV